MITMAKTLKLALVGITIAVAIMTLIVVFSLGSTNKIKVVEAQVTEVTVGGYNYAFTYVHDVPLMEGSKAMFYVSTELTIMPSSFETIVGKVYYFSGISIEVLEVYDNYCVLAVKDTT